MTLFELSTSPSEGYDSESPWAFIIERSAFLAEGGLRGGWWQRRIVRPITAPGGRPADTAAKLEGTVVGMLGSHTSSSSGPSTSFPPSSTRTPQNGDRDTKGKKGLPIIQCRESSMQEGRNLSQRFGACLFCKWQGTS